MAAASLRSLMQQLCPGWATFLPATRMRLPVSLTTRGETERGPGVVFEHPSSVWLLH